MRKATQKKYTYVLNLALKNQVSVKDIVTTWNTQNPKNTVSNGFIDAMQKLNWIRRDGLICFPAGMNTINACEIISKKISYQSLLSSTYSKCQEIKANYDVNQILDFSPLKKISMPSIMDEIIIEFEQNGITENGKWILKTEISKDIHIKPILDRILLNKEDAFVTYIHRNRYKTRKTSTKKTEKINRIKEINKEILNCKTKILQLENELFNLNF